MYGGWDGTEGLGFFYGSFMNPEVMKKAGLDRPEVEVATLPGFDIRIAPHATLVPSPGRMVFGVLVALTHAQLGDLYAGQSRGEVYLPEAVLTVDAAGKHRAAMCYIVTDMKPGLASPDYVEMIAAPAESRGFPEWYVERIRGFARSA